MQANCSEASGSIEDRIQKKATIILSMGLIGHGVRLAPAINAQLFSV
jgi:hypothetical protein